ncbi:cryptochrome/photolyase family protein [Simkania negevensis]|uniref:Deoxyribodipyrimidine photo-lyase n=1 Tax=Simkania negevensis (strain ATCC VR-1471 / DSM 27360 / Z) TaxID=331113 RepID=F8L7Q0_SIMNZ|nr:deoxyribodipyrimidine photo-lyase [Simkania negevensis]CCB88788.1 deoxyribodipyrimidine photo-lyase [Simkania negevensis Z]
MKTLFWFKQDLRLSDNQGLYEAAKIGSVLPIYILDPNHFSLGAASRVWLHHSLKSLSQSLDGKLAVFQGAPLEVIRQLVKKYQIQAVYWNRGYEPWQISQEKEIKIQLDKEVKVQEWSSFLLWEPWKILKADETPYKVFSPYYKRGCLFADPPRDPLGSPSKLDLIPVKHHGLDYLDLLPKVRWDENVLQHWNIGEKSAWKKFQTFLAEGLLYYKTGRDFPAQNAVSRLSPHLHFGEISPHQIWSVVNSQKQDHNTSSFLSELGWREFSYYLLYHFPTLPTQNFQSKFDYFPWKWESPYLQHWCSGKTGFPIVDAGMRELWQTGYMHNRVRMIVASFLVKNLLIHWQIGLNWFENHLLDADLASNSASWQWVAGSGADAAPYFRIFNPITQGEKFDPHGEYTRRYVPELKKLPDKYLFCPWDAPKSILEKAGVKLGRTYPEPIIDLKQSREEALQAFDQMKD